MTIKANINIRALKAAAIACSKEETCYYLQGVLVHTVGPAVRYVATDGHRMIILRELTTDKPIDKPDHIHKIIVPFWVIKEIKVEKHTDYAEIEINDDAQREGYNLFSIKQSFANIGGKLIDGSFPDYERIVPRGNLKPKNLGDLAQFNADYLADFQKAGNIIEKSTGRIAAVIQNGAEDPAIVNFVPTPGPITGFGIIMPVRHEIGDRCAPAWLDDDHPKPVKRPKSVKQNKEKEPS